MFAGATLLGDEQIRLAFALEAGRGERALTVAGFDDDEAECL